MGNVVGEAVKNLKTVKIKPKRKGKDVQNLDERQDCQVALEKSV